MFSPTTSKRVERQESVTVAAKSERIAIRVTPAIKERIERAAGLVGRAISDFATEALQERADTVIHDHHVMELSDRDVDALLAAIENPPPPNDALLRAFARRRALIRVGRLTT